MPSPSGTFETYLSFFCLHRTLTDLVSSTFSNYPLTRRPPFSIVVSTFRFLGSSWISEHLPCFVMDLCASCIHMYLCVFLRFRPLGGQQGNSYRGKSRRTKARSPPPLSLLTRRATPSVTPLLSMHFCIFFYMVDLSSPIRSFGNVTVCVRVTTC